MRIDLDGIINAIDPWDLEIRIGGQWRRTRPLTLADLVAIEGLRAMKPGTAAELLAGLFEPPLAQGDITTDAIGGIAATVTSYLQERAAKNTQPIASQVRQAMGTVKVPAAQRE